MTMASLSRAGSASWPSSFRATSATDSRRGGWVPEVDAEMRTSVPTVFAAGDCAGLHEAMLAAPDVARAQGRQAGAAASGSLGAGRRLESDQRHGVAAPPLEAVDVHVYWRAWLD